MKRPSNIQQVKVQPPPKQQNDSKIKFIKRSISQAEAAQQNINTYYKHPNQSLEQIREAPNKKPLSRKNSGMSPLFKNQLRAKDATIDVNLPPPKKFNTVQEIAMHMSANIFMLATTKFVAGFEDLSSMEGEARSYRKGPASPLKPKSKGKEGQSMSPSKKDKVEPRRSAITPSKVMESSVGASGAYGSNYQSPKFVGMSDVKGKQSKVKQSFAKQPSSSLVKSQTPKNPESSIHRIADKVYNNAARYGQQVNTPRPNNSHSPSPAPNPRERAVSQPAQKTNPYKPEPKPQPVAPKKVIQNKDEPSIINIGTTTPKKPTATPMKSTTPIKSTIGLQLQSKTDLPKPMNPYAQRNVNNQGNQNGQTSQPSSNYPIRNRFQNEVMNQATPQTRVPGKTPEAKVEFKEERKIPGDTVAAQYERTQTKQPEKSVSVEPQKNEPIVRKYPYNDTVIKQFPQKGGESAGPSMTVGGAAKSVDVSAYHMTSETYFNSTTKYNKAVGSSLKKIQSPKKEPSPPKKVSNIPEVKTNQTYNPHPKTDTKRPSLNSSRPIATSESKPEVSAPKPANEPVKPSGRPQSKSQPKNIQKLPEPSPVPTVQNSQNRVNRFQTQPAKKEEERSTSRNEVKTSKSIDRKSSNSSKREIRFVDKKEEPIPQPITQTQYRSNSLAKTQPVTVDAAKSQEKEDNAPKVAPFSRQPAGAQASRSPLLFTNKEQEKTINKDIKASTSPVFSKNQVKPYTVHPSKQQITTEKSIKTVPTANTASMPTIPAVNNRLQPTSPPQRYQPIPYNKEPELKPTVGRNGGKGLQSKPTQDSSFQSAKNTTNTLAASKSSEAIERLWKPVQTARPTQLKNDLSSSTHQEPSKKIEGKGFQRNTQPSYQPKNTNKPVQSEQSIKVQPQKVISRQNLNKNTEESIKVQPQKGQNIKKNTEPTSFKSIPSEGVIEKKNASSKQLPSSHPSAKNITVKSTTIVQSPQNSTIQNQTKPINNYKTQPQPNKPARTVTQATSPQPVSATNIAGSPSLSRNTPLIKSESHIKSVNPREGKVGQVRETERKEEHSNLQRSLAVVYSVSKLKVKAKRSSFSMIIEKGNEQVKHLKQARILIYSAHALVSSLLNNVYSNGLQQLKKSLIGNIKAKKEHTVESEQIKQQSTAIIEHVLVGKFREHWGQIKKSNWVNKQIGITHSPKQIQIHHKEGSSQIQTKRRLLHSFLLITKAVHNQQLRKGFHKILLSSLKGTVSSKSKQTLAHTQPKHQINQARSPQRPAKDYEAQKRRLLETKSNVESEVSSVEYRIGDVKKGHQRERERLIKKMEDFRKKNRKCQDEVNNKRKRNSQLKNLIQKCPSSENVLPEGEPLLDILTQIYVQVYRNTQEVIDTTSIIKKYSLNKEDFSSIIEEWNALKEQLALRSQINQWQGVNKEEGRAKRSLREENEVETNLMKTYIRERYLWEWVHTASARI